MAVTTPNSQIRLASGGGFRSNLVRRGREFGLIARDPVLLISLLSCGLFLFIFVVFPLFRGTGNGCIDPSTVQPSLSFKYFFRYFDSYYGPLSRTIFLNTLVMGLLTATGGTILGFVFAYTVVRCRPPGRGLINVMALVPTVSLATIPTLRCTHVGATYSTSIRFIQRVAYRRSRVLGEAVIARRSPTGSIPALRCCFRLAPPRASGHSALPIASPEA
jgi:hypothetical protein